MNLRSAWHHSKALSKIKKSFLKESGVVGWIEVKNQYGMVWITGLYEW